MRSLMLILKMLCVLSSSLLPKTDGDSLSTASLLTCPLVATQLPGANAGKPDVGGAAKEAAKKTPLGFINVGDLAFDLPGSNVSKDDLPNNVKPGDAAGLPKGPTAKPPSGPSLPKVCYLQSLRAYMVWSQVRLSPTGYTSAVPGLV